MMDKKLYEYRARKRREAFLSMSFNMFGGSSASSPTATPPSSPERRGTEDRVNIRHTIILCGIPDVLFGNV